MDQNDDRGNAMLEERLAGTSVRAIAKRHGCSSTEVEAVIDHHLAGELDNAMRLKAIKLDVRRLEHLMVPFFEQAMKNRDVAAGTLVIKIMERRSLLLGLDAPTKVDVVQLRAEEQPSSFDLAFATVMKLKYGPDWKPNGGDGAVGALSDSDDKELNH